MPRYAIVVGANYGDEGKGLITDYLAELLNARYVARFNGGAQAGHTVHRDGKRHVFSSFGAGTLSGRQTILTNNVVINPYAALKEAEMLRAQGINPLPLLISRSSPVTTQFEMLVNQMAERYRFGERHGSCGLGINETITRHLKVQKDSIPGSLFDLDEKLLHYIGFDWFPVRLVEHNILAKLPDAEWGELLKSGQDRIKEFKEVMSRAKQEVFSFKPPAKSKLFEDTIVYEGAQGLALDEFMGDFPHVTRSNTGIANALDHIGQHGGDSVVAVYVTRTFLTKHGAGNLKHEMPAKDVLGHDFVDETNVDNTWQQSFRYAPLNIPETAARIRADIARNSQRIRDYGMSFVPLLAVTFMDEKQVLAIQDEAKGPELMKAQDIANQLEQQTGIMVGWVSRGREATQIEMNRSLKSIL